MCCAEYLEKKTYFKYIKQDFYFYGAMMISKSLWNEAGDLVIPSGIRFEKALVRAERGSEHMQLPIPQFGDPHGENVVWNAYAIISAFEIRVSMLQKLSKSSWKRTYCRTLSTLFDEDTSFSCDKLCLGSIIVDLFRCVTASNSGLRPRG